MNKVHLLFGSFRFKVSLCCWKRPLWELNSIDGCTLRFSVHPVSQVEVSSWYSCGPRWNSMGFQGGKTETSEILVPHHSRGYQRALGPQLSPQMLSLGRRAESKDWFSAGHCPPRWKTPLQMKERWIPPRTLLPRLVQNTSQDSLDCCCFSVDAATHIQPEHRLLVWALWLPWLPVLPTPGWKLLAGSLWGPGCCLGGWKSSGLPAWPCTRVDGQQSSAAVWVLPLAAGLWEQLSSSETELSKICSVV